MILYSQLRELIRSLLEKFVQPHVLESNASPYKLINLDLEKQENLLPIESISAGFGAKSVLRNITTAEKAMEHQFRKDVQIYLISLVQKIFQGCPFKYKLTRAISSLPPTDISVMKSEVLKKSFNSLVLKLHDHRWISSLAADNAEK